MNDLIKKAKAGDERAFTKLIQNIQNDLYRVAQSKLSDNDDINDAIQNTMMNAYKYLKKLKDNNMFKSWVIKILVNECNRIYKMKFKRRKLFQKIEIESVKSMLIRTRQKIKEIYIKGGIYNG